MPFDTMAQILEFPQGYIDMTNKLKPEKTKVFVRECYPPLYEKMVTMSKLLEDPSKHSPVPVFILGTPGCGKSLFRMYVCHRLLQRAREVGKAAYILFQKAEEGDECKTVYVVCQEVGMEATTLEYRREHHMDLSRSVAGWEKAGALVVSLVDVTKGKFKNVAVKTEHMWHFSSPNPDLVSHKDRRKTNFADLYMPLWSLAELKLAQQVLDLVITAVKRGGYCDPEGVTGAGELIEHRFHLFGGSARAVLENPSQTDKDVKNALADTRFRGGLAATLEADPEDLSALASHSLFHVDADADFDPTFHWASPAIKARIAEAALAVHSNKIDALLSSRFAPGIKGEMVEALWFQRFKLASHVGTDTNALALRPIGTKELPSTAPTIGVVHSRLSDLGKLEEIWCSKDVMAAKIQELQAMVTKEPTRVFLLRPYEDDMMALDGFLIFTAQEKVCTLFLQATIAETHRTGVEATKYFAQLADAATASGGLLAFVFILPDYRYLYEWKYVQSFTSAPASAPGPKKATPGEMERAKAVAQFALCPGL